MQPVTFNWRKYNNNNKPHWVHHTHYLGEDHHGYWFLQKQNQLSERPGLHYYSETKSLLLLPPTNNWVAKIFPPNRKDKLQVYIDVAHNVHYNPNTQQVTGIDMDLDIIQLTTEKTWIEDKDEFATHSKTMQYPANLS